jgi:hypothetical protein
MTHPEHVARLAGVVAEADRRRRGREADRRLAVVVPVTAAVLLLLAGAGRFFGWSRWIGVAALGATVVAVVLFRWLAARARPSSDAIAARVDDDAAMRGELRSAHWFEANAAAGADPWADYHLATASNRVASVDWPSLYPSVRAPRQWVAGAVMAAGALAISLYVPARASTPPVEDLLADPQVAAMMTPEMAKKLAQLMAQLQDAALPADAKALSLEEFKEMMAKLDPSLQKKLEEMLAKGLAKNQPAADPKKDARPDRAENSAAGLPEDVKWAQEDMAARMAQQQGQDRETNPNNPSASSETGEKGMGSQQAEQQAASAAESASPLVRESANDPGGKMMMGGGGPMGGDSRPGAGGNNGAEQGAAQALLIAQALKKSVVEAAADALGENVDKDDLRKKTEQGKSSLGFTRVAPRTFDPSRAAAPPPVPEARRQLLLNYFIRK